MRPLNLTAKLKDMANTSIPELSFQCKAVQDYHSRRPPVPPEVSQPAESSNNPPSLTLDTHLHDTTTSTPQAKCAFSSITSNKDVEDASTQPEQGIFFLFLLSLQLGD